MVPIFFGLCVSISETSAAVGAPGAYTKGNYNQGKAYVFEMPENSWVSTLTETAQLVASDGKRGSFFGSSVCILENEIVVGAHSHGSNNEGKAYTYFKH
jgi:hypothetical protein